MKRSRCLGDQMYDWLIGDCARNTHDCDKCYAGSLEKINDHPLCVRNGKCIMGATYIVQRNNSRFYDICVGGSVVKRVDCGPTEQFNQFSSRCNEDDAARRWRAITNFTYPFN